MHIIFLHFEIIEIMFSIVKIILFFNSQFFMYVTDADCWSPCNIFQKQVLRMSSCCETPQYKLAA